MSNKSKSFKKTKTKSSFLKNLSIGQKISLLLFIILLLILPIALLASSKSVKLFKKAAFINNFNQSVKLIPQFPQLQRVEIPASTSMMTSPNFTVEAWIKPSSAGIGWSGPGYIVARERETGKKETYSLQTRGKKIYFQLFKSRGSAPPIDILISGKTELEPEKWYHVAGIVDDVSAFLFVNGQPDAETASIPAGFGGDPEPSNLKTFIGCLPTIPDPTNRCFNPFYGEIDEVRISRYPSYYLLNPQIPTSPLTTDEFTQGLWHFDNNFSDSSGNNNNGQSSGNVSFVESTIPTPIPPTPTPTEIPIPTLIPTKTPTLTPTPTPAPSCSLFGPIYTQSNGQTTIANRLSTTWFSAKNLTFTPDKKGKLDKIQLYVSGTGQITAVVTDANNTPLTNEVTVASSSKGKWLTFNFSKEPIVKTTQGYVVKFKSPTGTIYVHSGKNYNWGTNIFIKPCLN